MIVADKSIAIVGAGPGGLTLARLLQLKGANVKVFERDVNRHARVQGSPLDMHEGSGLAAIEKAELMEAFKQYFRLGADRMVITDPQAQVLYSDHETKLEEDFGNAGFRPEIDRGPLRIMLLEALEPGTVIWDSHFISMEPKETGWLLHFKNGTTAYADLVVAADGANSKIRPYLTGIKPVYSGVTMVEGNVHNAKEAAPNVYTLANGGKIMAFGNGQNLLLGQKGNGDLGFYASIKVEESWANTNGLDYSNNTQMLEWFKTTWPGWSSSWYELFQNAAVPFIPRPIYVMPFNEKWETKSNLVLIGDAAHVMPPFAGEGANMAMLDALELSECLTGDKYGSMLDAITAYESAMISRGSAAAKESLENGEQMHSANALETMLDFFSQH